MLQPACRSLSRLLGGAIPLVFRVSLEEAGTRITLFDGLCVTLEELILAQAFWIPGPDLPAGVSKLKRPPVTGLVILACSSGCTSCLHANLSRNSLCVYGALRMQCARSQEWITQVLTAFLARRFSNSLQARPRTNCLGSRA